MTRIQPARLLAALILTLPIAGCLAGPSSGDAATSATTAALDAAGCDRPLLDAKEGHVRGTEVDVRANPRDPDELAAVFKVAMPPTRALAPDDNALWNALARSTDGGRTWRFATLHGYPGDPSVHAPSLPFYGAAFLSDPVVAWLADGTLVYAGLIARAESVDLYSATFRPGALEPDAVALVMRGGLRSVPGLEGLPAGADQIPTPLGLLFDDGPHIGFDPATNKVVLGWAMETLVGPDPTNGWATPMIASSTDGKAWTTPQFLVPDGRIGGVSGHAYSAPRPVVAKDGSIHAFVRDHTGDVTLDFVSKDGSSYAKPVVVASGGKAGPSYSLNANPAPAVDPASGALYVVWSDLRNGDADVFVTRSAGDGTWSAPVRVNDDAPGTGAHQFFAFPVVEKGGAIDVVYNDRRADAAHKLQDTYLARSTDDGATWTNARLTSAPSDNAKAGAPVPLGVGIGDYIGIAATSDAVVPVWIDARHGTSEAPTTEIYLCRVLT